MKEKVDFVKPKKPKGNEFYYTAPDIDKNKRISCVVKLSPKKKVEKLEIKLHDYSNVDMEIILNHTVINSEAEDLLKFFDRILWAISDPQ